MGEHSTAFKYGCLTEQDNNLLSYDYTKADLTSNSRNNGWNVNSSGNSNNNNRYNRNTGFAVSAYLSYDEFSKTVLDAYEDCLRGKRNSPQALEFSENEKENLDRLTKSMYNKTWVPDKSKCFVVDDPKPREVFAAWFGDRIVHHWIIIRMLPIFEERCVSLGDISHACRKGHGTKAAVEQLEKGIKLVSDNYTKEAWIYRGDIVGFFMNINNDILLKQLFNLIDTKYTGTDVDYLKYFVENVVKNRPELNCYTNTPYTKWYKIEEEKSFFCIDKNKGQPIGNLTAQHFANYYMSFSDEYVVNWFKERNITNYCYTRNVDDFCVVCEDKYLLKQFIKDHNKFLLETLGLRTHIEKVYFQEVKHGVKFLGQWIKPFRRYTINRTVGKFRQVYRECFKACTESFLTPIDCISFRNRINSYYGSLKYTKSYKIKQQMREEAPPEFYKYFTIVNDNKIKIKYKW